MFAFFSLSLPTKRRYRDVTVRAVTIWGQERGRGRVSECPTCEKKQTHTTATLTVSPSEHLILDSQQNLRQTLTLVTYVLQNQLSDHSGSKFRLSEAKKVLCMRPQEHTDSKYSLHKMLQLSCTGRRHN